MVLKEKSARPPTDRRGGLFLRRLVTPERSGAPSIRASVASQRVSGHRNVFPGTADRERYEPSNPDPSPTRLCGASESGPVGRSGTTVVPSGKAGCRGQSRRSSSRVTSEKASRWSGRLWRRSAGPCSARGVTQPGLPHDLDGYFGIEVAYGPPVAPESARRFEAKGPAYDVEQPSPEPSRMADLKVEPMVSRSVDLRDVFPTSLEGPVMSGCVNYIAQSFGWPDRISGRIEKDHRLRPRPVE